jgi:hypothetical protein
VCGSRVGVPCGGPVTGRTLPCSPSGAAPSGLRSAGTVRCHPTTARRHHGPPHRLTQHAPHSARAVTTGHVSRANVHGRCGPFALRHTPAPGRPTHDAPLTAGRTTSHALATNVHGPSPGSQSGVAAALVCSRFVTGSSACGRARAPVQHRSPRLAPYEPTPPAWGTTSHAFATNVHGRSPGSQSGVAGTLVGSRFVTRSSACGRARAPVRPAVRCGT